MRNKLMIAAMLAASALCAQADDSFHFRLSPGPRLVGTRADSSGSGDVAATFSGSTLTLDGKFSGLVGTSPTAHLSMGTLPGTRGPKVADLMVSGSPSGTVSGKVKLNAKQIAAFRKGGLYVEIDSSDAPEGDLWGWVMPPLD